MQNYVAGNNLACCFLSFSKIGGQLSTTGHRQLQVLFLKIHQLHLILNKISNY